MSDLEMLWNTSCFVTRLVASSVRIAETAGGIIKHVMSVGDLKIVNKDLKGDSKDLQTEADRSAQYCIEKSLQAKFGSRLKIIGEEEVTSAVPTLETAVSMEVLQMDAQVPAALRGLKEEDVGILETANWTQFFITNVQFLIWVDPLDGTSEFTKALSNPALLEQVTVLIGITCAGRPVAGVVHQPYYSKNGTADSGRTVWGIVGVDVFGTAKKNSGWTFQTLKLKEVNVDSAAEEALSQRTVVSSASHSTPIVDDALNALINAGVAHSVERVGGAGFKVLRCLEGAAAYVFASGGCKKWDTAAPEALLIAAGGRMTDVSGRELRYDEGVQLQNSGGVLATAPGIDHGAFLDQIPRHVKDALPEELPKQGE